MLSPDSPPLGAHFFYYITCTVVRFHRLFNLFSFCPRSSLLSPADKRHCEWRLLDQSVLGAALGRFNGGYFLSILWLCKWCFLFFTAVMVSGLIGRHESMKTLPLSIASVPLGDIHIRDADIEQKLLPRRVFMRPSFCWI